MAGISHAAPDRRIRIAIWSAVAALLMLPAIAMRFTHDVAWDAEDFLFAAVVLGGAAIAYELLARMAHGVAGRAAFGLALVGGVLLLWITGAVGLIGNEGNRANLAYPAMLALAMLGAAAARFRPGGMALVLGAMAVAQFTIGAVALVAGLGSDGPIWPWDVTCLSLFFAGLWLASAALFRMAARPDA